MGSILEGLLLARAQLGVSQAYQSSRAPRDKAKTIPRDPRLDTKQFDWCSALFSFCSELKRTLVKQLSSFASLATPPSALFGLYRAGRVTAFFSRVTAVCANSRPFADAPVFMAIFVLASITPSKCAVVPMATAPEVCQKIFLGSAPPFRITFVALA